MPTLFWIILLIVLGFTLLITELIILPGITIAGVLAFCSLCGAAAWTFATFGLMWGFIGLGVIITILVILLKIFFKPSTWKRVALATELSDSIDVPISELCQVGAEGSALTRIAPMGSVSIDGKIFEAKALSGYIDPGTKVRVTGFENQNIIIEKIN